MKAISFEFGGYSWQPERNRAEFRYRVNFSDAEPLDFVERVTLLPPRPASGRDTPPSQGEENPDKERIINEMLRNVHLMLGISYYKTYCPPEIILDASIKLTSEQADYWNTVYKKGLGEFWYMNKLDPTRFRGFVGSSFSLDREKAGMRVEKSDAPLTLTLSPLREREQEDRVLLGIGGGIDSIVAGEWLKKAGHDVTALVVETGKNYLLIDRVIETMNVPALRIRRDLDDKLLSELPNSFKGHVPVSGVYAWLGMLAAKLYGHSYFIVGNEYSSDFGNLEYKGEIINHQWSKSTEFEKLTQKYVKRFITTDINYFSLLRPFYGLRIAREFSKYKKYFKIFSSCNRNFRIKGGKVRWCGQCAKCAYSYLILAAWLPKEKLATIFGKDLLADEKLALIYKDLLGEGEMKPFDCVGTFEEAQAALWLVKRRASLTPDVFPLTSGVSPARQLEDIMKVQMALTVPTKFRLLGMNTVLLLGYGREGKVTKKYLRAKYPELKLEIADEVNDEDYLAKQEDYDLVIRTPGIAKNKVTRQYTTATNMFMSEVLNTNSIVGVTGTKGKSTTASLIYKILLADGKRAQLLGNIGQPMLTALLEPIKPDEFFVLELSSYQLDDIEFSPHIAVVLNLWPDHMDYHGGIENYYAAKQGIIKHQKPSDFFVYNPNDERLKEWKSETVAETVAWSEELPLSASDIPLPGEHNKDNVRAAATVARLLEIPDNTIKKAVKSFKPLPHRLEKVSEAGGIRWYDDAISTTPESTIKAMEALSNIKTIFLGGEDRGYDFSKLETAIRKAGIVNVVLFPSSGSKMLSSRQGLNVLVTDNMKEAVKFAWKNTPSGSGCLLSTGSPSYSLWQDYEEQGRQFKQAIIEHEQ